MVEVRDTIQRTNKFFQFAESLTSRRIDVIKLRRFFVIPNESLNFWEVG